MPKKKTVVISLVGTTLDRGHAARRWERWRPNVAICQQEDFLIDRLELLYEPLGQNTAKQVTEDIATISEGTEVRHHPISFENEPWDFEYVYEGLHNFADTYPFDPDKEDYLLHITTGTHVAQICWFLLCESHIIPARLLQSNPGRGENKPIGDIQVIDLDLAKYDRIATRFEAQRAQTEAYLKHGIATRNTQYNQTISQLEQVALHSDAPILLSGPTGAGKSFLAERIYQLRQEALSGRFVTANCATLRGDMAFSTLFGHIKGSFTGAQQARKGLLLEADGGLLFLDEIGELGLDEQAMLLKAIEEKNFYPMGSDKLVQSDFQLICGSNRNLLEEVRHGRFRQDLLTRINLWHFTLPGLADRREDIEPNIEYELARLQQQMGKQVRFNREAYARYLAFGLQPDSIWSGNFRDLAASITRMCTLSQAGRISEEQVQGEIRRLQSDWAGGRTTGEPADSEALLADVLGDRATDLDLFDRPQLAEVIRICRASRNASEAGRKLFQVSREKRKSTNDGDRIRKYLMRFELTFEEVRGA